MSSPGHDAAQDSSKTPEQLLAKPSKRPASSLGRHSSSWINRLHRHHDRKHHRPGDEPATQSDDQPDDQPDSEAQRPLLAGDDLSEQDEEAQAPSASSSSPSDKLRRFSAATKHHLLRGYHAARAMLAHNAKPILIACLLALLTLLASTFIGLFFHHKYDKGRPICQSAACVHAASEILYSLDPDYAQLDACTQFDKIVCGGWRQQHDLRPDQGDIFTGTLMAEKSKTILRHILEQGATASFASQADQDNFQKLKDDYDSCLDEPTLQQVGIKPLQEIANQIETLFPATIDRTGRRAFPKLETSSQKGIIFDGANQLTNVLVLFMKLDIAAFLAFHVEADDRDPDSQVLMITPPRNIGLPSKEYYENDKIVYDYRKMTADVLQHFLEKAPGNTSLPSYRRSRLSLNKPSYLIAPQTEIGALAEEVVDLEVKLAAATPPTEDQEDVTKYYNPLTVAETHALLPQVSFDHVISQLAPDGYSPDKVIVGSPSYVVALSKLLSSTKKETLQAFLIWKAVQQYEKKAESPVLQPLRAFNNQLRGLDPSAKPERWRTCIDTVDEDLGWILSKFFVENAFSESSKKFGDQIVTDIKESFVATLGQAEWMTDTVRRRAIQKVHAIDQKIGYPTSNPNVLDPEALQEYYSGVVISNSTFFENRVQVARFDARREWNKLGKPTPRDEWGMTVPTVNAYYNPAGNEIVFPAGIMQAPIFYEASVPQYLTYGAFGAVSGHELSHAFDSTGSHYDETGNYTDWFDESTKEAFDRKTKCFVKQYSDFTVAGPDGNSLHVNGKLTLGENIADAGGLHAAFAAWKRREAEKPSKALPGLQKFSDEQLFFISYGNWWCDKSTAAKAVERIFTDPHAPKWARILGTMANSAEFKQAFKCESVEPTCALW